MTGVLARRITCPECGSGDAQQENPAPDGFAYRSCACGWEDNVRLLPEGFQSLQELQQDPNLLVRPEPVIPFLAWRERLSMLAAREKEGKSTFVCAGAAAVSNGRDFLSNSTVAGTVLWLALEEHAGDVLQRFERFDANPAEIIIGGPLLHPLKALEHAAALLKPKLIVVDTLAALAAELVNDPSSSVAWTKVMNRLTRIARDTGAAVLILHHSRKSDGSYRDSSAIGAGCDVLLEMATDRHEPTVRRITGKGRLPVEALVTVRLTDAGYELVEGTRTSLDERIKAFLRTHPGVTSRDLRNGVEGRGEDIDATVRELIEADEVIDDGTGNRRAYRLALGHTPDTAPEKACPAENPTGQGADTEPDTLDGQACPEPQTLGEGSGHAERAWSLEVSGE